MTRIFQDGAQTPDKKPGRELALRAEGFFYLDFLVILCQDKRNGPAAMSGEISY